MPFFSYKTHSNFLLFVYLHLFEFGAHPINFRLCLTANFLQLGTFAIFTNDPFCAFSIVRHILFFPDSAPWYVFANQKHLLFFRLNPSSHFRQSDTSLIFLIDPHASVSSSRPINKILLCVSSFINFNQTYFWIPCLYPSMHFHQPDTFLIFPIHSPGTFPIDRHISGFPD